MVAKVSTKGTNMGLKNENKLLNALKSPHIQVCVCALRACYAGNDSWPNDWTSVVSIWRLCRLYVTPSVYWEKQAKESPK